MDKIFNMWTRLWVQLINERFLSKSQRMHALFGHIHYFSHHNNLLLISLNFTSTLKHGRRGLISGRVQLHTDANSQISASAQVVGKFTLPEDNWGSSEDFFHGDHRRKNQTRSTVSPWGIPIMQVLLRWRNGSSLIHLNLPNKNLY